MHAVNYGITEVRTDIKTEVIYYIKMSLVASQNHSKNNIILTSAF